MKLGIGSGEQREKRVGAETLPGFMVGGQLGFERQEWKLAFSTSQPGSTVYMDAAAGTSVA